MKYTMEINIILAIPKSYSLTYTWDQGHALGINFYFRKLLFCSGRLCGYFLLQVNFLELYFFIYCKLYVLLKVNLSGLILQFICFIC